ncbi:hypothetical protein ACJIZ3_020562 [Penstemon smallii]|uniref:Chaperone protein DnaJ n=1 Tax=Penstemon smallii TaxID=265156 RepID=A0ABD3SJU5_9LAMI
MFGDGVSKVSRMAAAVAATCFGGAFSLYILTSSISQRNTLNKKKSIGKSCGRCKGIGYYTCKLCKGNGTIMWSPLYDPVFINPCVCPTCDGFKVQHCLNCLGYGCVL